MNWLTIYSCVNREQLSGKSKNKWVILSIVCFIGLLFSISIPNVRANTLEQLDFEEGDAVWYDLIVSAAGPVGVNAWTDSTSENDNVYLYLYDQTGKEVTNGYGSYNMTFG
jgi:hypothetical protein